MVNSRIENASEQWKRAAEHASYGELFRQDGAYSEAFGLYAQASLCLLNLAKECAVQDGDLERAVEVLERAIQEVDSLNP